MSAAPVHPDLSPSPTTWQVKQEGLCEDSTRTSVSYAAACFVVRHFSTCDGWQVVQAAAPT